MTLTISIYLNKMLKQEIVQADFKLRLVKCLIIEKLFG